MVHFELREMSFPIEFLKPFQYPVTLNIISHNSFILTTVKNENKQVSLETATVR